MVNAKTRPHGDHFNTIRPGMHKYIEWLGGPESQTIKKRPAYPRKINAPLC